MSLDKFGRASEVRKSRNLVASASIGLAHTPDGDTDIENLKVCNVKTPTLNTDAVNKGYVDQHLRNVSNEVINNKQILSQHEKQIKLHGNDVNGLTKQLHDLKEELHTTKFPTFEKHLNEINEFISRNPPTASKHMATKKYVDDVIVITKKFIRADLKKEVTMFTDELNDKIKTSNVNLTQLNILYQNHIDDINRKFDILYKKDFKQLHDDLTTQINNLKSLVMMPKENLMHTEF
ncbi:unnamed protein product [Psylliodes chrysocephalus]|uniref:Uncharacterized protein n=1 Tax=Psylliodes chrysocephalus TaxID=3402493 RepID=A0A9P0CYL4_9CUCU|nr:unnamed protein product [Psylliodes chrysocephala]